MLTKKSGNQRVSYPPKPPFRYEPERMVGIGFRCWLAGYETGDINCWEAGWNHISRELSPQRAKPVVAELACWVRVIRAAACRKLEYYPVNCAGFCRDECFAISMIAACQHNACPALRACAFALIGESLVDPVVSASEGFAGVLSDVDINLSADSITQIAGLFNTDTRRFPN